MKKIKKIFLSTILLVTILIPTKIFALEFEEVKDAEALISAVEEGKNIKLTSDILNVDKTLLINKEITVDLNGKNVSFTNKNHFEVVGGNLTITGKGTVKEENPYYGAVMLRGSENIEDKSYSVLTVGKDAILEGWAPIFINQKGLENNTEAYGVVVNLYGTLKGFEDSSGDRGHGIYLNGQSKNKINYPIINVFEGAKITTPGDGIYAAGYAKWNIEGATITGGIGLGIKAGIFNLKNVTVIATDSYKEAEGYGNGINSTGAAIQIESNNGYAGAIDITIDKGSYTSNHGYAVQHYLNIDKKTKIVSDNKLNNLVINGAKVSSLEKDKAIIAVDGDKILVTGGTFSSSVAKYITSEYVEIKVENEYVVAKKELKVDTPTIDTTKPVEEVTVGVKEDDTLKDTLEKAIKDSRLDVADINAIVIVTIDNQKEEQVPEEASKSINELAKEKENIKVVSFFDITLNVKNNVTGETLGTLSTLDNKIKFNMALPEELTKVAEGYTRKYYVVRYHDGKSEIISASVDGNVLSFESDKFSTYALAYEDVKNENVVNPPTSDKIVLDLVVGIVSVAGLGLIAKSIAKRKKYFN